MPSCAIPVLTGSYDPILRDLGLLDHNGYVPDVSEAAHRLMSALRTDRALVAFRCIFGLVVAAYAFRCMYVVLTVLLRVFMSLLILLLFVI